MTNPYLSLSPDELETRLNEARERVEAQRSRALKLDLTRGKPSVEQLDMVSALGFDTILDDDDHWSEGGVDCRNYGQLEGLPELRAMIASWLDLPAEQVLVHNNSSLRLMYDAVTDALLHAPPGGDKRWIDEPRIRVICPSPGYDRHFALCDSLGLELVPVAMRHDGPDMDQVEALAAQHDVKLMFCVPQYSNPEGIVYSEAVCRRLATMEAAPDFRIIWDNAYRFHHFDVDDVEACPSAIHLAAEGPYPDRFVEFISTSKISYAGSGVSAIASSPTNIAWILGRMKYRTIGPDKMNQLRHLRLFKRYGLDEIMRRHAAILRPKFELCERILRARLGDSGLVDWHTPGGGYFIGLRLIPGLARAVVARCADCGVSLTPAGATWPHGQDPEDSSLRLAPTFPSLPELEVAVEVLCDCIELCALEQAAAR